MRAMHSAENGCLRSMLVTMTGISTRSRVPRLVALGVSISILRGLCLRWSLHCPNTLV